MIYLALLSSVLDDNLVNIAVKGLSSSRQVLHHRVGGVADAGRGGVRHDRHVRAGPDLHARADFAHRTLVLYEAVALREEREKTESNLTAYIVRSLLSEGEIRYPAAVRARTGKMVDRMIVKEGPTNFIVTTTAVSLHGENETRMLSLPSDDSRAQTRAVLLSAARERKRGECDHREWHLRRWIAQQSTAVLIPYAEYVAARIPPAAVRLRRDWDEFRSLIKAHALLHQLNRPRDAAGAVVATLDDYAAVRDLAGDLIAEAIGATVPGSVRETVAAVAAIATRPGIYATVRQIADRLGIERPSSSRRLTTAAQRGYVTNVQSKRGQPALYEVADAMPTTCAVLPKPVHLCTPPLHTLVREPDQRKRVLLGGVQVPVQGGVQPGTPAQPPAAAMNGSAPSRPAPIPPTAPGAADKAAYDADLRARYGGT